MISDACSQAERQHITTSNLEWRAMGNMCLAARSDRIELAFCDGSAAQRWNFWDADPGTPVEWDPIQQADTGACVAARTATGAGSETLTLASCSAADSRQHFDYLGSGFIGFGSSWCLKVLGGEPIEGLPLGLWSECKDPAAYGSQFYVSGQFKSFDLCLSTRPPGGALAGDLDKVGIEACASDAPRQVWDFHF